MKENLPTNYTVADGTEIICDRAFLNCQSLESVTLPDSVKEIGESAFSGCRNLRDVNIPDGVTVIRQGSFRDCDSLSALELPASVTSLEKFSLGKGLTTLVCNAAEMDINRSALFYCSNLSTVMVPPSSVNFYAHLLKSIGCKAVVEPLEDFVGKKTITISLYAVEKMLDVLDKEEDPIDCRSQFSSEDFMYWSVDDNGETTEYSADDFADLSDLDCAEQMWIHAKELDVMHFISGVVGAERAVLNVLKSSGSIRIEIPANEKFDPKKFALVLADWIYPAGWDEQMICGFVYDGKYYDDLYPEDGRGISSEQIWPDPEE